MGKIITFTGFDGVGKTTHTKLLAEKLSEEYNLSSITMYDVKDTEKYTSTDDLQEYYEVFSRYDVICTRFYLYSEENYKQTQQARRDQVRRLVTNNFTLHDKFVTLTFKDCITDIKLANAEFKKFVLRMRRRYPEFQYVAVIEFMKNDGRIHYHMVCNLPYIPNPELRELWANGFVTINDIYTKQCDNIGAYVTKYMHKDLDDPRLKGLQAYNRSRGLVEPSVYRSWEPCDIENIWDIDEVIEKRKPSYEGEFHTEQNGTIRVRQYNMKRKGEYKK